MPYTNDSVTASMIHVGVPTEAVMTLREFNLERRRAEVPIFLRVLKALPDDCLS